MGDIEKDFMMEFVITNYQRFIVVVKKMFRYSNVFSYNHLYQPECFYEKRYN